MVNRFIPPSGRRGKKGLIDEYPDVVGQNKRAEHGLAAPNAKKPITDEYPQVVGNTSLLRRVVDREVAKSRWKPPVDKKPGAKGPISTYPRVVTEDRFPGPAKKIKIPPLLNEDGSIWEPPDDHRKPRKVLSKYPDIVNGVNKIGRPKRYRPPSPNSHPDHLALGKSMVDSVSTYYRNCLGMTGEGLRTLLDYDQRSGRLTWKEGSGPRSLHDVPINKHKMVKIAGIYRNMFGVIYLLMLDRLPRHFVLPLDYNEDNLSWENIRPSKANQC